MAGDEIDWTTWRNSRGNRRGVHWMQHPPPAAFLAKSFVLPTDGRDYPKCIATTRGSGHAKVCSKFAMRGSRYCHHHARRTYGMRRKGKRGGAAYGERADKPIPAPAAPPELRALPAWRACVGQRERNALVHAWGMRESDPASWRKAVKAVLATGRIGDGGGNGEKP